LKKSKKALNKKKIANNRLGMLVIGFVAFLLLGGMVVQSSTLESRLAAYDAKADSLEEAIENEKARTEEIEELKKYMETDEYAEEVAREKLGLVKDNEIVFKEEE